MPSVPADGGKAEAKVYDIAIPRWLSPRTDLNMLDKWVWARLKFAENGRLGIAVPKQTTLAEEAGVSRKQINRSIKKLSHPEIALLVVANRGRWEDSRKFRTCRYYPIEIPEDPQETVDASGTRLPPKEAKIVQAVDATGTASVDAGGTENIQPINKKPEEEEAETVDASGTRLDSSGSPSSSAADPFCFSSPEPDQESDGMQSVFLALRKHCPGIQRGQSWEGKALETGKDLGALASELLTMTLFRRKKDPNPWNLITDAAGRLDIEREEGALEPPMSDAQRRQQQSEENIRQWVVGRRGQIIDVKAEGASEPAYTSQRINRDGNCFCKSELFVSAEGPDGPVTLCAHCDSGKLTIPILKRRDQLEDLRAEGHDWDYIREYLGNGSATPSIGSLVKAGAAA